MTRNEYVNVYLMHPFVLRLQLMYLRFLMFFNPSGKALTQIQKKYAARNKRFSFTKVLHKGEMVAVQGGVAVNPEKRKRMWYDNYSDLWTIARHMGPKGIIIAFEPTPGAVEKIEDIISVSNFKCNFHIVGKGLFSKKQNAVKFVEGKHTGLDRLRDIRDSESWFDQPQDDTELTTVATETLDNFLKEKNIDPKKVGYVNLTINGAEYDALQGMTNLLQESEDISITLACGRDYEGNGSNDIGFINGEPDHIVIKRFMMSYGFKVKLHRFTEKSFGYLVCTKGSQREFM